MKKRLGQWFTKKTQYKNLAPRVSTCYESFRGVYTAECLDVKNYTAKLYCAHAGKTEISEANVLFTYGQAYTFCMGLK